MTRRVFIDSWGWFGYMDKKDPHHRAARETLDRLLTQGVDLCTSGPVIVECVDRVRKRDPEVMRSLADWFAKQAGSGYLELLVATPEMLQDSLHLRLRHGSDPDVTFVDCTTAILLREAGIQEILTGDQHFRYLCEDIRLLPEDRDE